MSYASFPDYKSLFPFSIQSGHYHHHHHHHVNSVIISIIYDYYYIITILLIILYIAPELFFLNGFYPAKNAF